MINFTIEIGFQLIIQLNWFPINIVWHESSQQPFLVSCPIRVSLQTKTQVDTSKCWVMKGRKLCIILLCSSGIKLNFIEKFCRFFSILVAQKNSFRIVSYAFAFGASPFTNNVMSSTKKRCVTQVLFDTIMAWMDPYVIPTYFCKLCPLTTIRKRRREWRHPYFNPLDGYKKGDGVMLINTMKIIDLWQDSIPYYEGSREKQIALESTFNITSLCDWKPWIDRSLWWKPSCGWSRSSGELIWLLPQHLECLNHLEIPSSP